MIDTVMLAFLTDNDPLQGALDYHKAMTTVVDDAEQAQDERLEAAETVSRSTRAPLGAEGLPPLLALIRSNESGGDYTAYNPTGCEGWGCGGAYQLHAQYAPVWAERAGYPGLGGQAQTWAPATQDAVALYLYYSTNPDGAHWCSWTSYC